MVRTGRLQLLGALAATLVLLALPPAARADAPPDLAVKTLMGEDFDLAAQRGHVVLVHFWATWCAPCIKEMPALGEFLDRYRARGVTAIALSEDRLRDVDEVHHMMHHMAMNYPVAMAHAASRNSFGRQAALPVTLVIDASGAVRATLRPDKDPLTVEALERVVLPLLAPATPHS